MTKIANLKSCGHCPFSLFIYTNSFKFMCGFKKEWNQIPVNLFFSVWLEMRSIKC
jgi:hypothetical protein